MVREAKFCSECGQAIPVPNPPFCSQCGASLANQADMPPSEPEIPSEPPIVETHDKSTEEQIVNAIRRDRDETRALMDRDARGCIKWALIGIGGIVLLFIWCVAKIAS